jgi:alkylated DNA nucleotide flippase Atl1
MTPPINFYEYLLHVLEQIPPGKTSTHMAVAEALGDPVAVKAVKDALERERFAEFRAKIVESAPGPSNNWPSIRWSRRNR